MKTIFAPRRAVAFLLVLLMLLAVGCETMPDTVDPSSDTASETEPVTESDTGAESETTDTASDESTPESDTAAGYGADPEAGSVAFYDAKAIKKLNTPRLSVTTRTDEEEGSYLACAPRSSDPWIVLARSAETAVVGARYMRIRYRTSALIEGRLYLGEEQLTEAGALTVSYQTDGEWRTLELDLSRSATYAGSLAAIRFDPMDGTDLDSEALDIAWIGFYPDVSGDPTENLPALPEDAPDLSEYQKTDDGGAYYRASGYLTAEKNVYTFQEGFALDLYRRGYFNRYSIGYSSSSPLKGEITYLMWGNNGEKKEYTEEFFLEAGTNLLFHSLIDDYFSAKYAWGIERVTFSTCDGSTATFSLHSLTDTVWQIYPGTYYMENDRYKLGVILNWGGGISYIEDKEDGDEKIQNLINRADPGRLVQQSYYGIKKGSGYTPGVYNGTEWRYNPVQGGDMYGNGSKLVDVQVSADGRSIYIKCRPMDWAKNNEPTPSYMENTYTLEEDFIRVGNRFVDFFGVEHPAYHAELPAFYTISHLGVFHYYNGTKPWTNDAYISLPNEPFWAGNGEAYHNIVKGNTETWAAWTNEAGYGIGLYVPEIEIMLAGRHEYNGSKDSYNGATSYVAPLRTMTITSFVPFEYEYVIAAGHIDDMRDVFRDYVNGQS